MTTTVPSTSLKDRPRPQEMRDGSQTRTKAPASPQMTPNSRLPPSLARRRHDTRHTKGLPSRPSNAGSLDAKQRVFEGEKTATKALTTGLQNAHASSLRAGNAARAWYQFARRTSSSIAGHDVRKTMLMSASRPTRGGIDNLGQESARGTFAP